LNAAVQARTIKVELVAGEMVDADRPEAHLNLGLLDLRRRNLTEAEEEYRTALRLDPIFVPALVNLADLDRAHGMDEEGAELLRKAMAIEPDNADVRYALGFSTWRVSPITLGHWIFCAGPTS
jgi:Tfp pilus assembly protein PilF